MSKRCIFQTLEQVLFAGASIPLQDLEEAVIDDCYPRQETTSFNLKGEGCKPAPSCFEATSFRAFGNSTNQIELGIGNDLPGSCMLHR